MATLEELVIQLSADTASLKAEMNTAAKITAASSEKMEKAITEFTQNSSKNLSFFESAMAQMTGFLGGNAVLGAFNFVKDAASAFAGELVKGADAAMAEELALTRLANSLALSGNYTKAAQADLTSFIGEMEELTGVNDDVVASNLALLSSVAKLDSEGLKQAQKAALDLSAAMGIDLNTATQLVAKGVTGNVEAFKRYGLEIKKGATDTENFTNVVGTLSERFGGAAAGAMRTFSGSLTGANNMWGNFTEEIAKSITQNPVVVAGIQEVTNILKEMTSTANSSGTSLKESVAKGFIALIETVRITITVVDGFIRIMEAGLRTLILPINAVADGIRWVSDALTGAETAEPFKNTIKQFEDIDKAVRGDSALLSIESKLHDIQLAGEASFDKIKTSADALAPSIANNTNKVVELTAAQQAHLDVIKAFATGLADQTAAIDSNFKFQSEALAAQKEMDLITEQDYFTRLSELQNVQFVSEQEALNEALANKLISQDQYQAAVIGLEQKQAAESIKIAAKRVKSEEAFNAMRLQGYSSFFGNLASLQQTSSKEAAALGKAAAISQATIDGYVAIQGAYKSGAVIGGPILGGAYAAAATIATGVNLAKIAGVGLQSGITEVPRSAGGGNTGDNFPAVLQSGERVLDRDTNKDLKEFLANQGGGSHVTVNLNIAPGTGITSEQASNIVEGLNDYFAQGGLKLSGAN
jgi:hypothetical protein